MADTRDHWRPATLLARLAEPVRAALLSAGQRVEFADRRTILHQGSRGDHVFLLENGLVKVSVHTQDGQDTLLDIRTAGDMVGEMAALEGAERMATVTTCGPVRARRIFRRELDALVARYPVLGMEMAKMVSSRLRWASNRRVDMASCDAGTRLSRVLVDIVTNIGGKRGQRWELGVQLTQPEIASLAGMKQRTVEQQLARLQEMGLIERQYRRIEVVDLPGLRALANAGQTPPG